MNQVILIGLLDGMPSVKPTARGEVLTFSLNVPRRNSEVTDQVDVVSWDVPEGFWLEMHRDRRVKIVGRLAIRKFTIAGKDLKVASVVATGIQWLGDRDEAQVAAAAGWR